MLDRLKDAFKGLPPEWQVWLVGLSAAVLPAVLDAIADAGYKLLTGAEPVSKASLWKVVVIGLGAGITAGQAFKADSPMPRRAWTYAERQAEAAAARARARAE